MVTPHPVRSAAAAVTMITAVPTTIRRIRWIRHLTQHQAAQEAQLSYSTYQRVERGDWNVRLNSLMRILEWIAWHENNPDWGYHEMVQTKRVDGSAASDTRPDTRPCP